MQRKCTITSCIYYDDAWMYHCAKTDIGEDLCIAAKHLIGTEEEVSMANDLGFSFDGHVDRRCDLIKKVLGSKAAEYAKDNNRFHNFDVAAMLLNTTPEKALIGMMIKHFVSMLDMVEKSPTGSNQLRLLFKTILEIVDDPESYPEDYIEEKCGDMINYIILLEGLLKVRRLQG